MRTIKTTHYFDNWFSKLKDKQVRAKINVRIRRLEQGYFGDHKSVGDNVSELRLFFGAGYRIYYSQRHGEIIILLCAGDKSSQIADIKKAKVINEKLELFKMKVSELKTWDIQDHLKSPSDIAAYLDAALQENDPDFFLAAIGDVIKARGAKEVAASMGHGDKSLYKSIKPGAKPKYDTVFKMINALGLKLTVSAEH
jgi:putative addiction module killer protein/probable addiction module antidote protein